MTGLEIVQIVLGAIFFAAVVCGSFVWVADEKCETLPELLSAVGINIVRAYLGILVIAGVCYIVAWFGIYLRYIALWLLQAIVFAPLW